jgi:hypothetical protein
MLAAGTDLVIKPTLVVLDVTTPKTYPLGDNKEIIKVNSASMSSMLAAGTDLVILQHYPYP